MFSDALCFVHERATRQRQAAARLNLRIPCE